MSVSILECPVIGRMLQNSQGRELHLPKFWLRAVVRRCGDRVLGQGLHPILQGDILRCGLQPLQMGENSLSSQDAEALPQKRAEPHQMGGKQPPAASLSS